MTSTVQGNLNTLFLENLQFLKLNIRKKWRKDTFLYMFHTHTMFDYADPDKPIRSQYRFIRIKEESNIRLQFILHSLQLYDNIYSAFSSPETISYMNLEK